MIIFFVSPLYFLIKGKWLGFIGNLILYILALLTILLFGIGVIFWLFGVIHAMFDYRKEEQEEITTKLANKIAKANAEREKEKIS